MAVTVTNSTIAAINTAQELTNNAATSSTIDETEVFTITLTRADAKAVLIIDNPASQGTVTYSIAAGTYWAAGAAKTGSVAQAKSSVIQLEGAKYMNEDREIKITFTPATGKRLLTDHTLAMKVVEVY